MDVIRLPLWGKVDFERSEKDGRVVSTIYFKSVYKPVGANCVHPKFAISFRPCHPERNEVEPKFARRVINERANRKAFHADAGSKQKRCNPMAGSNFFERKSLAHSYRALGFLASVEIPRLRFVAPLGMTLW